MSSEDPPLSLKLRSKQEGAGRCLLCHDEVCPQGQADCAACGATYHPSCLSEFGASCATAGCGAEISLPGPTAQIVIREASSSPMSPPLSLPSGGVLQATGLFWVVSAAFAASQLGPSGSDYLGAVVLVGLLGWCVSSFMIQGALNQSRQDEAR